MSEATVRFCIRCGHPVASQFLFGQDRPVCPSCGWIYFADPKVAAAMLVEQDGRILLARRANEPFKGLWSLPAGFVDAHEDPARAAERECLEETGLAVTAVRLLDVVAGREHERGADMLIVYAGQVHGGTLQAGDDADEAGFFDPGELPPLAFQSLKRILEKRGAGEEKD